MGHRPKGALFRLIFAAGLCGLFLGMTLSTDSEETDGCGGGHESGTLTIVNKSLFDTAVELVGPVDSTQYIAKGGSISIKTRTGFYHWVAFFGYLQHVDWDEGLDTGVVTVKKDKSSTITIHTPRRK